MYLDDNETVFSNVSPSTQQENTRFTAACIRLGKASTEQLKHINQTQTPVLTPTALEISPNVLGCSEELSVDWTIDHSVQGGPGRKHYGISSRQACST